MNDDEAIRIARRQASELRETVRRLKDTDNQWPAFTFARMIEVARVLSYLARRLSHQKQPPNQWLQATAKKRRRSEPHR